MKGACFQKLRSPTFARTSPFAFKASHLKSIQPESGSSAQIGARESFGEFPVKVRSTPASSFTVKRYDAASLRRVKPNVGGYMKNTDWTFHSGWPSTPIGLTGRR